MKRNKFSKALKHLKSKKRLDETAPTNSMSGVYQVSPSTGDAFRLGPKDPPKRFYPKADGTWPAGIPGNAGDIHYDRPAGYWGSGRNTQPEVGTPTDRDYSYGDVTAKGTTDTTTLIRASDGKVYTSLPPNTESFILGPVVTSYAINHGYDDYTNLGYIQKDTRQFVLLARIQGFFKGEDRTRTSYGGGNARTWDGSASDLTIYNSNFTLEHALWMRETYLSGNFKANFPFNFAGGIPVDRHPDNSGMGGGDILGTDDGKESKDGDSSGTEQDDPDDTDLEKLDLWGLLKDIIGNVGAFGADPFAYLKRLGIKGFFELGKLMSNFTGVETAFGMANAFGHMNSHFDNNNPLHPDFRKHDPTSDNYVGPKDIKFDPKTAAEVTEQLDTAISNLNNGNGPKNPNGNLTKEEIKQIDDHMNQPFRDGSTEGWAVSFYNTLHSLPPDTTTVTVKDGKFDKLDSNYVFTDPRDANPIAFDEMIYGNASFTNFLSNMITGIVDQATGNGKPKGDGGQPFYKHSVDDPKYDGKNEIIGTQYNTQSQFKRHVPKETDLNFTTMSFVPQGNVISERKRILREVKRPVLIEATPKTQKLKGYKPNFKGKFSPQNTPDVTASKKSDEAVHGYNTSRMAWTSKDKFWKGYETTERMNVIYDRVGFGQQYFDEISGENLRTKVKKKREVQEHLNQLAHQKAMREVYGVTEFQNKIDEAETYDNKVKDPLFAKVADRLKKEIDYANKPSPHGYPKEAPAKIDPKTGMHPKYGKRYKYDKLDPVSAVMMKRAPTGDPEIDANVKKAAQERKEHLEIDDKISEWMFGKLKRDWRKEIEEGMTTGNMLTAPIPPAGDEVFDDTPTTSADVFDVAPARDPGFSYNAMVGTDIKSSGSGSGDNGGFNIGDHVAFDGEGSTDGARWCVLKAVDTTKLDTMVVRAITGNGSNGGETPDDAGEGLVLYYKTPEMYDYIPITYYPTLSSSDFQGGSSTIIPLGHGQSGLQDYQIKIPPHARKEGTRFLLYQFESSASGRDTYGITNISFRRQTPVNVIVPLDSPEAISFISVGVNEGDPKKRKKRVDDMLKASDEYTAKQMGGQFPGQGTKIDTSDPFAPSPLTDPDSSPIGKDSVTKAFKDFSTQAQAEQEPAPAPEPPRHPSSQASLIPKDEDGNEIPVKTVGKIAVQGADAAKLEAETEPETETEPEIVPEIKPTSVDEPEMKPSSKEDEDKKAQAKLDEITDELIKRNDYVAHDVAGMNQILSTLTYLVGAFNDNLNPISWIIKGFGGKVNSGKLVNNLNIARSIFSGKVENHIPLTHEIKTFTNSLIPTIFDNDSPSYIPISDERHPYADDNIIVDLQGNVSINDGTYQGLADKSYAALGDSGKGYAQLIIPQDGGRPYVHYYDYNYHNLNSPESGEVPNVEQEIASAFTHLLGEMGAVKSLLTIPFIGALKKAIFNFEEVFDSLKNKSGLEGWPPGIHGAALTDFKVDIKNLPEETQRMIANHPLSWTPQRIANMTPEDFTNQAFDRFERFKDVDFENGTFDDYVIKALEDPDSVTDAEFAKNYKRFDFYADYDEETSSHPDAREGTVQYDYDKAVEEIDKIVDTPEYSAASLAASKEYEDILAERDKKIDEIGEKYDTGKLWEKLVGPHYRAVQRAGNIEYNSPTYQKMVDGYNQYEKQSKIYERKLSAERSALMDEYDKLSDEAYARYEDTFQVRKLDDGTTGLLNGGDFKTKNGKIIPGMDTVAGEQKARFDEVRAEYDEIQKYFSSANWARNFYQAFVLYDVKTQFAEFGVSGENWSPKRIGSGNTSDPEPSSDPNFGSAGDFFGGDATAAATAAANRKKKGKGGRNESLEYFANPNGKVSLYEKLKTREFFNPKDIKPTFPPNDPPEIDPKTKMHANYGKQAGRYKKLDPMSANAMPATGDPEIDAVVDKQRTGKTPEQKKKDYVKTASRIKKLAKKR